MGRHNKHKHQRATWASLKDRGSLSERHVLMAIELGLQADKIEDEHRRAQTDSLLLEWVEDRYFESFGRYYPVDEKATPEAQAEHPARSSLLPDPDEIMNEYLRNACFVPGSDDEPADWHEEVGRRIAESEKLAPVSYGEIHEDQRMLKRQEDFRKAARLLARHLAALPEVRKVMLFGSVPLPLWKEVPRFHRLRQRRIKIFHECGNIDLAAWVTDTASANTMRKACSATVSELLENDVHLNIAHHYFCIHLVDQASGRYQGMVCHYNQCPKQKEPCRVPGCGASKFVQVLPWFDFKPARLNSHNSQVLFDRDSQ